jgi:hypothetical protein
MMDPHAECVDLEAQLTAARLRLTMVVAARRGAVRGESLRSGPLSCQWPKHTAAPGFMRVRVGRAPLRSRSTAACERARKRGTESGC